MASLPVLMYHNVSIKEEASEGLTISVSNLERHFKLLHEKGYSTFHFSDLQEKNFKLPKKSVIITFDDVYKSQLELAYSLLKKYNLKACFYIPFKYIGKNDGWNNGNEPIMSIDELKSLDPNLIELGHHSYKHRAFDALSINETNDDLKQSNNFIKENNLNISPVIAYPYGKFPRKGEANKTFAETLKEQGIVFGLRIGNRINKFPFKNNYEIQRIDIKGEDTLQKFSRKLKYGAKLF